MMTAIKLEEKLQGKLLQNELMAKHTSWRVGGPAEMFYEPSDLDDLSQFLQQLDRSIPVTFVGLGSNMLVRDGGIKGAVIAPLSGLTELKTEDDYIYAEAGVSCAKFARFCKNNKYVGADFLAGIPGTMGGAAVMNAGAFGSETWEFISHIAVMDHRGVISQLAKDDLTIAYREVSIPEDHWVVAMWFKLAKQQGNQASKADIKYLIEKRNASQPIGLPSCGSVFRNPENDYAARLIEYCGLKGHCIGGACVSEKHANFIISSDGCSAADIENLIEKIQFVVKQETDVALRLEAHILGDKLEAAK